MAHDIFPQALAKVLVHEGGYVNHPADPGGATNKGVTQAVYDAWRDRHGLPRQSVRKISEAEVREIYRRQYWQAIRGDELPRGIDYVVFDGAVNSGPRQSAKWLQRALGIEADGSIGERTLLACREHPNHDALIAKICAIRLGFLQGLRHWPTFGKGWTARVAGVRRVGQAWASGAEEAPPARPVAGGEAKAPASDMARPSETAEDSADALIVTGPTTTAVSQAAQQLEPLQGVSPWLGYLFAGLTVLGLALLLGGVVWRLWIARKARRARRREAGLVEADLPEIEEASR